MKGVAGLCLGMWLASAAVGAVSAETAKSKFGPDAVPLPQAVDYLRQHPAPDYWALSVYYVPQATSSACSVASIAMVINALRGLPSGATEALVTQAGLLETAGNDVWSQQTAEGGAGVTVAELVEALQTSLQAYGLGDVQVEVLHPDDGSPATLEQVRHLLSANERSSQDVVLAYFNQGVLTGDWDGPHISPIGAYDAPRHQVLILDVDRQWYVPYWSGDDKLLAALLRPAPAEHGELAGQTGSLIRVYRAPTP
jgi:hypothetical protein